MGSTPSDLPIKTREYYENIIGFLHILCIYSHIYRNPYIWECLLNWMVKVTFSINDSLDKQFRATVAKRKGLHKGVLGESLEEAIDDWISSNRKRRRAK